MKKKERLIQCLYNGMFWAWGGPITIIVNQSDCTLVDKNFVWK
jgi:hypothetical protein